MAGGAKEVQNESDFATWKVKNAFFFKKIWSIEKKAVFLHAFCAYGIAFGNKIALNDRSALIEATCTSALPKTSFRAFGGPEKTRKPDCTEMMQTL